MLNPLLSKNAETWHYLKAKTFLSELDRRPVSAFDKNLVRSISLELPSNAHIIAISGNGILPQFTNLEELNKAGISLEPQDLGVSWKSEFITPMDLLVGNTETGLSEPALRLKIQGKVPRPIAIIHIPTVENCVGNLELRVSSDAHAEIMLASDPSAVPTEQRAKFVGLKTRFLLDSAANLKLYHFQENHLKVLLQSEFQLRESAELQHISLSLGGKATRMEADYKLLGAGARVSSLGLSFLTKEEISDFTSLIDHQVGGCWSEQRFKNIVADKAKASFTGKVYIAKNAQKAESEQLNRNLILSRTAEANSRPQLQVYADDVKAAHGSTFGQLSEEEIFYIQSRGIKRSEAQKILTLGFAQEYILGDSAVLRFLQGRLNDYYNQVILKEEK